MRPIAVGLLGTGGDFIVLGINDSGFKVDVEACRVGMIEVIWGSAIWSCLYWVGFGSLASVVLSGSSESVAMRECF